MISGSIWWWNLKGILYYELLNPKQTVKSHFFSQQLRRSSEGIEEKRSGPGHDNARSHFALST